MKRRKLKWDYHCFRSSIIPQKIQYIDNISRRCVWSFLLHKTCFTSNRVKGEPGMRPVFVYTNRLHISLQAAAAVSINRMWAVVLKEFPFLHYSQYLLYTSKGYSHRIKYKIYLCFIITFINFNCG